MHPLHRQSTSQPAIPLKICVCFSSPGIGGAEVVHVTLARKWKELGMEVAFVNFWDGGKDIAELCSKEDVPFVSLDAGKRMFRPGSVGPVISFFRERRFDICLVCGLRLQLFLRFLRRRLPDSTVWNSMLQGMDDWRKTPHILADRWTQRFFDFHIAVSESVRNQWLVRERYPPERLLLIPNGVDVRRFAPCKRAEALRSELGIPEHGIVCMTAANLRPVKGHRFLVRSLASRAEEFRSRNVFFLWLGRDFGEYQPMTDLLRQAGLADRLRYPGAVPDIRPYVSISDMFVVPSRSEGMPLALQEIMAMELPGVATAVGGTLEILRDGTEGYLVEYDDTDAMASKILLMIDNARARRQMGKAARTRIREYFDINAIAGEYLRLFQSTCGVPRRELTGNIARFMAGSRYESRSAWRKESNQA